jgi:ABC-type phosphate/phosphonate transport system substrate-binding protein
MRRWLCLLLAAMAIAPSVWADEVLTLGVLSYRPKEVMQRTWQPLADYLTQAVPGH